jgi:hypothetical protein
MLPGSFLAIGSEDGRTTAPECIGNRYFKGLIDEVAIFNRALSAAEIQALCAAQNNGEPMPATTPAPPGIIRCGASSIISSRPGLIEDMPPDFK